MPNEETREMILVVKIKVHPEFEPRGYRTFYRDLRQGIKDGIEGTPMAEFVSISVPGSPDPYDFPNPDKLPEGVR